MTSEDLALEIVATLARNTAWLAAAAVAATLLLRLARASWPPAHRAAWLVTLVLGWAAWQWNVEVPWYDPQPTVAPIADALSDDALSREILPDETLLESLIAAMPLAEPAAPIANDVASEATIEIGPSSSAPAVPIASPRFDPDPVAPAAPWWTWSDWPLAVIAIWLTGVVVLPVVWLFGYLRFVRRFPPGQEVDSHWQREWNELLFAHQVRRAIPLRVTESLGPMLCRLPGGYELIVPERLWRELEPAQRRAILRHELAHQVRGDVWTSLVVRVLALPHWFNPLAWYAVRRFDEAAEWACDRAATADVPATTYAKALVLLGETCPCGPAYGTAASGHSLAARVRRVLLADQREDSWTKKCALLAAAIVLAAVPLVRVELVAREPGEVELADAASDPEPAAAPAPPDKPQPPAAVDPAAAADAAPSASPAEPDSASNADEILVAIAKGAEAEAAKWMVDEAAKAFQASLAAFKAETATLDAVYGWSLRWMAAQESGATSRAAKNSAVRAHLGRMRELQQGIKALYDVGTRDGEEQQLHAVNYYVAEAQRILARLEAREAAALLSEPPGAHLAKLREKLNAIEVELRKSETRLHMPKISAAERKKLVYEREELLKVQTQLRQECDALASEMELAGREARPVETTQGASSEVPSAATVVDLEIRIAELEGQLDAMTIDLEAAHKGLKSSLEGQGGLFERQAFERDVKKFESARGTMKRQLDLYRKKLAMVQAAQAEGRPAAVPASPPSAAKRGTPAPAASAKPGEAKPPAEAKKHNAATETTKPQSGGSPDSAIDSSAEQRRSELKEKLSKLAELVNNFERELASSTISPEVRQQFEHLRDNTLKAMRDCIQAHLDANSIFSESDLSQDELRNLKDATLARRTAHDDPRSRFLQQRDQIEIMLKQLDDQIQQIELPESKRKELKTVRQRLLSIKDELSAAIANMPTDSIKAAPASKAARSQAATEPKAAAKPEPPVGPQTEPEQTTEIDRQVGRDPAVFALQQKIAELNEAITVWRGRVANPESSKRIRQMDQQLTELEQRLAQTVTEARKKLEARARDGATDERKTSQPAKQKLLYEGGDLEYWTHQLQTDLSPERQKQAVEALTAFGLRGEGARAAKAILEAMQESAYEYLDMTPQGQFKQAAIDAFGKIPPADAIPMVLSSLTSEQAKLRRAAIDVIGFNSQVAWPVEVDDAMRRLLKDPDDRIRREVAWKLVRHVDENPGVIDIVRESLASKDNTTVVWALSAIQAAQPRESMVGFVPDLVRLSEDRTVGWTGPKFANVSPEERVQRAAAGALLAMGKAALPEIEKSLQSAPESERPRLRRWHEVLQKQTEGK